MTDLQRLWVDKEFKHRLKKLAADQDISLAELTKQMSRDDLFADKIKKKNMRVYKFGI